jgi:hypothetical protein
MLLQKTASFILGNTVDGWENTEPEGRISDDGIDHAEPKGSGSDEKVDETKSEGRKRNDPMDEEGTEGTKNFFFLAIQLKLRFFFSFQTR